LGTSIASARFAVLLFSLAACVFWFRLVRLFQDRWTAAASTVLLALSPGVLGLEKAVMLEVPSLAFCIAASYYWIRYLREETEKRVYWCAVFATFALLTKQQSVYLAPFFVFDSRR
jgi:4-amino-4-deoxy-L-arabinose transferase-like glycosyltransferase